MALNLAQKFSEKVDERFTKEAYSTGVCGNAYDFDGVDTIKVYNVPTVPMTDYGRHGVNGAYYGDRYGNAIDLQAGIQTMTITKDRSFTFTIDRGDITQQMAILEANKAMSRQTNEVIIPEVDRYIFQKLSAEASAAGNKHITNVTKATPSTAYSALVDAQEFLGDHMAPDEGRIAICSYAFANLLKKDDAFTAYTSDWDGIRRKGDIGMIDGLTLKQVPSNRLPAGFGCLVLHPYASVNPKQLQDYKIHDNPPGLNGWKVEGRMIYDAFVLDNKVNGLYYIGMTGVNRALDVTTSPDALSTTTDFKILIHVEPFESGKFFYRFTSAPVQGGVANDTAITTGTSAGSWKALSTNNMSVAVEGSSTWVEVVEVDGADTKKVIGYGKSHVYKYDALRT